MDGVARQRRAAKIRMNKDSGTVDDGLKPAGTEFFNRPADKDHSRFKVRHLFCCSNLRQFATDNIDNNRPGQITTA